MKKFFATIIISLVLLVNGKAIELSDSLRISMLTVSQGTELYSTFGHTAIRVTDLRQGYDLVFNYGTFDFRTPNFYIKFALGQLDYILALESFERFMDMCLDENRSVIEQELNFNKDKTLYLASLLIENCQPENKAYRYKFFTDNCATRVRDILVKASGNDALLSESKIKADKTFRQLYIPYVENMPWSRFGTELLLGSMTDQIAGYDALFLPDNLMEAASKAKVDGNDFIKGTDEIFKATPNESPNSWFSPILMGLIVVMISLLIQLKKNWTRIFDKVFFALFGLFGLFVFTMMLFSNHHELHTNWLLLFILPTNIILVFLKDGNFRKKYCIVAFSIFVLGLLSMPILPQSFNFAVIVMSSAIAVRLFFNFAQNFSFQFLKK